MSEKRTQRTARLLSDPIKPTLARLALPMLVGILGMGAFNMIDTYFVGKLGTDELAGLSLTFPVVFFVNSALMGLGIGIIAVLSKVIGKGDHKKAEHIATDGLALAFIVGTILFLVSQFAIDPILHIIGEEPNSIGYASEYMHMWLWSLFFVSLGMISNNILRGAGDMVSASVIMVVAMGINAILDPIFIFGMYGAPEMGVEGAAFATVLSRVFSFSTALLILRYKEKLFQPLNMQFSRLWGSWKEILKIGAPASISQFIMPLSMAVLTSIVAVYGNDALAGFGAGGRLDFLFISIPIALNSVMVAFVGQNLGAKKHKRVSESISTVQKFMLLWGLFCFVFLYFFKGNMALLFSQDPAVLAYIEMYLSFMSFAYGLMGIMLLTIQLLNVFEKPLHSTLFSFFAYFVLVVPFAYVGSLYDGIYGLLWGVLIADGVAALIAYIVIRKEEQSHHCLES